MASTDFLPAPFRDAAKDEVFAAILVLALAGFTLNATAWAAPAVPAEIEESLDAAIEEQVKVSEPEDEFAQLTEQWSQPQPNAGSAGATSGAATPPLVPNETFESYDSARGAILGLLKTTKDRVAVITPALLDGDLATTLHSLKLSQKNVVIVIDNSGRSRYNSRHQYLMSADIPVYFTNTKSVLPKNTSLIVIDNVTLAFGAPHDPAWQKSVSIRPSTQTPAELFAAINAKGRLLKVKSKPPETRDNWKARPKTSAKPSTNQKDSIPTIGGTIDDRIRLRARPIESKSSEIPRSLPKNTRMKEILSGSGTSEEPVKPVRLLREDTLRLNSEGELRAD
jgi:hypothetical protein